MRVRKAGRQAGTGMMLQSREVRDILYWFFHWPKYSTCSVPNRALHNWHHTNIPFVGFPRLYISDQLWLKKPCWNSHCLICLPLHIHC
jgi:hypothetical protein